MTMFEATHQKEILKNLNFDSLFKINDDILCGCIGLGIPDVNPRISGFSYGKSFGYALLTYFAGNALAYRRLPFCEDRIYRQQFRFVREHQEFLKKLTQERIDAVVTELRELYLHTQSVLKSAGLTHVKVIRWIGKNKEDGDDIPYYESIIRAKRSAELLGIKSIEVDMDMLNSFGGGAYSHLGGVKLELSIPIEDILYFSSILAPGNSTPIMESGEWVAINRSPNGIVSIPVDAIDHPDKFLDDNNFNKEDAIRYMESYVPIVVKPLEQKHFHNYSIRYREINADEIEKITPSLIKKIVNSFKKYLL